MTFYQLLISRQWNKAKKAISEDVSLVDTIFPDGKTILMKSLQEDSPCMTRFLLENGADVNIQDKEGFTVLMIHLSEFHSYPRELFKNFLCTLLSVPHDLKIENNYGYNIRGVISLDADLEEFIYELQSQRDD